MTLEEYLNKPFKYDGNGKPVPISDIWMDIPRARRRTIQRLLKKGEVPNIVDYL